MKKFKKEDLPYLMAIAIGSVIAMTLMGCSNSSSDNRERGNVFLATGSDITENSANGVGAFSMPKGRSSYLKAINLNLWHTLNVRGLVKMGEMQTKEEKESRMQAMIEHVKKEDPDILFLQEVNPINTLSKKWAKELDMDRVTQMDNCGIKILGAGIPVNLKSGLAILAKKNLNLKKIGSKKLSGGIGTCNGFFKFQLAEFRYAVGATIDWQGESVLLVNTHLHHQIGDEAYENRVMNMSSLTDERKNKVSEIIRGARERRTHEVSTLLGAVAKWSAKKKTTATIVSGDFNAEVDDPELSRMNDEFTEASSFYPASAFDTWNPNKNALIKFQETKRQNNEGLKPAFEIHSEEAELESMVSEWEMDSRRIDLLWMEGLEAAWGLSMVPVDGDSLSDHYGFSVYLKKP